MKVMKFGGASLADAPKIQMVAEIIAGYSKNDRLVIVVSAMKGVTDKLVNIFKNLSGGKIRNSINELKCFYDFNLEVTKSLELSQKIYEKSVIEIEKIFGEMMSCLFLKNSDLNWISDNFITFGEKISAKLLTSCLNNKKIEAKFIDSARLIRTNNCFGNADPDMESTSKNVEKIIYPMIFNNQLPVVTGFYGSTKDGRIATLGRGGSDYSATILANCLEAEDLILWKEVDGLYTKDPKKQSSAVFLPRVNFKEADKMAKNGAKILHPKSLEALSANNVKVFIKNVFRPDFPGTLINNTCL